MLEGEIILFFSYTPWSYFRGDNELALLFAERNKVLYVEPQKFLEQFPNGAFLSYLKSFYQVKAPEQINRNLIVLHVPPMLPRYIDLISKLYKRQIALWCFRLSNAILCRYLRRLFNRMGVSPTIFFFHNPYNFPLIDRFDVDLTCWRVYDEVSLYKFWEGLEDVIEQLESRYVNKIDLIFASSSSQYEKRVSANSNTYLIPHVVRFDHYNAILKTEAQVPSDLATIPRPIVGFFGVTDGTRMDFDLLKTLSTERPSWSIVILGLVQTSAQEQVMEIMRDSSFKNIYFLGYKGYDELPLYLKHFDVSIIPYKLNRSTITMYPKKVHEILAVGKPIVSSGMPELRSLREVISIATSPREFVEMVEAELKNDSWERQKRRIEIAKEHSWEKYVVIMENLMEKTLSLKRVRK